MIELVGIGTDETSPYLSSYLRKYLSVGKDVETESKDTGFSLEAKDTGKELILLRSFFNSTKHKEVSNLILLRITELLFILSIKKGKEKLYNAFANDISINCLDSDGLNALEYASRNKDLEVCAGLIFLGIDLDYQKCPAYRDNLSELERKTISIRVNHRKIYNAIFSTNKLLAQTTIHNDRKDIGLSRIKQIYDSLFKISGEHSYLIGVILKATAYDALVKIHVDVNYTSIKRLYAGRDEQHGTTVANRNEIYIAGGLSDKEVQGTMIHEFTHLACARVWDNNCKPYAVGSPEEKQMAEIRDNFCEQYKSNSSVSKCVEVLMGAFSYSAEKIDGELMARVPEVLVLFGLKEGLKLLKADAPELLEFYSNKVLSAISDYLDQIKEKDLQMRISSLSPRSPSYSSLCTKVGIFTAGIATGVVASKLFTKSKCTIM